MKIDNNNKLNIIIDKKTLKVKLKFKYKIIIIKVMKKRMNNLLKILKNVYKINHQKKDLIKIQKNKQLRNQVMTRMKTIKINILIQRERKIKEGKLKL